jgi:hypothetical protein
LNSLITARLTGYFVICFLFFSCCEEADLKILSPARAWNNYKGQQEFKFRSESGDTISFNAFTREYFQKAADNACGNYEVQTIQTTLTSPADPKLKTIVAVSHEVVVSIKTMYIENQNLNLNIKFNTVSELFISDDWRDKYLHEVPVNGKKYNQVLHVYGQQVPGDLVFADFLYAKGFGLIGFKTFDNKWFYLI